MKIGGFKKFIFVALSAAFFFIACEKEDYVEEDFAITSLSANGSPGIGTTKLIFTVNSNKYTLTADDLVINAVSENGASFFVIKDELKKTGAMAYELSITPGYNGTIRMGLDPYRGFTGWNAKDVKVYAYNYFSETSEGTITITGASYRPSNGNLTIPDRINGLLVTAIGNLAFYGKGLINVTIPNSVRTIENDSFAQNQLSKIEIPRNVTSIGHRAFAYNQLTEVTIINPNSVFTIDSGAFGYNQLSGFTIPENVTNIANSTFAYNRLTEVIIPKNVSSVSGFNNNKLTKVEFVEFEIVKQDVDGVEKEVKKYKVTTIGSNAFAYNELEEVDIPDSVTKIENYAFAHNNLESITIPKSVTNIGSRVFAYNKLKKVIIPDSVRNIEIHAFIDNPLTCITIGKEVSLGSAAFGNDFERFYYNNGREKATYRWDNENKTWIKKEYGDDGDDGGDDGDGDGD